MALELTFIEPCGIEAAERRRQAAECADERKLRRDDVDHETEASSLRKLQTVFGLALHVDERITRREKVPNQVVAGISCHREIADGIRGIEGATDQIVARSQMSGPRDDEHAEGQIRAGPEPLQPTPFDQVVAEPAEAEAGLVVAKSRSGDHAKPDIGITGRIGVAVFQAEIDHSADEQRKQIRIREHGRCQHLGQNIQGGHGFWFAHQGQIDELLNLAASEQ